MVWAVSSLPEVQITAERLDIREFSSQDADLVREALSIAEPEALPPGTPAQPEALPGWLAEGVHQLRRSGGGVHLMMLDRARTNNAGCLPGSRLMCLIGTGRYCS